MLLCKEDTKEHFKLLHEALERTNSALEDLHARVVNDKSPKADFHDLITAAKESLQKAEEDLKKYL